MKTLQTLIIIVFAMLLLNNSAFFETVLFSKLDSELCLNLTVNDLQEWDSLTILASFKGVRRRVSQVSILPEEILTEIALSIKGPVDKIVLRVEREVNGEKIEKECSIEVREPFNLHADL